MQNRQELDIHALFTETQVFDEAQYPKEQEIITEVLEAAAISAKEFDFVNYKKLFPLIKKIADQEQGTALSEEDRLKMARTHTAKLIILFAKAESALVYLGRFIKRYPDQRQPVHDACEFSLPNQDDWDVDLWRAIVAHNMPESPHDLVMRLLPMAGKIEEYVQKNQAKLIKSIEDEVNHKKELEWSHEYDALHNATLEEIVNKKLKTQSKKIKKESQKLFGEYLREKLGFPEKGKLTLEQAKALKNRSNNLEEKDTMNKKRIEEDTIEQSKIKIKEKIEKEKLSLSKNKPEYIQALYEKYKGTIQAIVKAKTKNLLSPQTTVNQLINYTSHCLYQRANENPAAAKIFFENNMSEKDFNEYLSLVPIDDENFIPDVLIPGVEISKQYEKFYLKKLEPSDPRAAILGKLTSCCQSIGDMGSNCAKHGITNARGGFYVICKKMGSEPQHDDPILAQCWAWRSNDGKMVFDSIESQLDIKRHHKSLISDFYFCLADYLVSTQVIPAVMVGTGGNTPYDLQFLTLISASLSYHYKGYRDSGKQALLAQKEGQLFIVEKYANEHELTLIEWISRKKETLLSREADINARDIYGITILHQAAAVSDNLDMVHFLVERGADVNARDIYGITILHRAAKSGNLDMVRFLVEHGADVHKKNKGGNTVLHEATCAKEWGVVRFLVEHGADINAENKDGKTVLHVSDTSNSNVVRFFVRLGVDINAKNNRGLISEILSNAIESRNLDMARFLVEHGADVNSKDKNGYTILHEAVRSGNLDIVRFLVEHGADVNAKDKYGYTILYNAVESLNLDMVCLLVEHGANVNKKNNRGHKILREPVRSGNLDMVRFLVEHGADVSEVNAKDKYDYTILREPVISGNLDMVRFLVEHGANVNAKGSYGETILDEAIKSLHKVAKSGNLDMVRFLVEHGADVNAKRSYGKTILEKATRSLHKVAKSGNLDMVRFLVELGADVNVKNSKGKTAEEVASLPKIKSFLKEAEARFQNYNGIYESFYKLEKDRKEKEEKSLPTKEEFMSHLSVKHDNDIYALAYEWVRFINYDEYMRTQSMAGTVVGGLGLSALGLTSSRVPSGISALRKIINSDKFKDIDWFSNRKKENAISILSALVDEVKKCDWKAPTHSMHTIYNMISHLDVEQLKTDQKYAEKMLRDLLAFVLSRKNISKKDAYKRACHGGVGAYLEDIQEAADEIINKKHGAKHKKSVK